MNIKFNILITGLMVIIPLYYITYNTNYKSDDNTDYEEEFKKFKDKYNKIYTKEEEQEKFNTFKANLKYINDYNNNTKIYHLKLNSFGDIKFEDFERILYINFNISLLDYTNLKKSEIPSVLGYNFINEDFDIDLSNDKIINTPKLIDISSSNNIILVPIDISEFQTSINEKNKITYTDKILLKCTSNTINNYFDFIKNNGILFKENYSDEFNCDNPKYDKKIKSINYYKILDFNNFINLLKCSKVVLMSMYINKNLMFMGSDEFYDDPNTCNKEPNTFVLLVGVSFKNNSIEYFKFRTLLGNDWGDNGYFKMKVDNDQFKMGGLCNILKYDPITIDI